MRLLAASRSDEPVATSRRASAGRADELVAEAAAIVITLPLTEGTHGLIGRWTTGACSTGLSSTTGSGGRVREDALAEAVDADRLAVAALGVVAEEPLPEASPLWAVENVTVSPHTSALSWHENERISRWSPKPAASTSRARAAERARGRPCSTERRRRRRVRA